MKSHIIIMVNKPAIPASAQVCDAIHGLGYIVDTQVGFSGYRIDLAVVHPSNPHSYIMGIECDGATFHSARSARERDVARQRFLEAHGWTIERVWSRNWWRNRQGEIHRLKGRIDELAGADRGLVGGETPSPGVSDGQSGP